MRWIELLAVAALVILGVTYEVMRMDVVQQLRMDLDIAMKSIDSSRAVITDLTDKLAEENRMRTAVDETIWVDIIRRDALQTKALKDFRDEARMWGSGKER